MVTRAWLDWLAREHPDVPVWLDCVEPGRASHLFLDAHPLLRVTNTLWELTRVGADQSFDDRIALVERMIETGGSPQFDLGLEALRGMQSIHLLGGGYLNSMWESHLLMLPALARLKERHGTALYATGLGLVPLSGPATMLVPRWLAQFDHVEARDAETAKLLGSVAGADDAFLAYANGRPVYATGSMPDVMIIVQRDLIDPASYDTYVDAALAFTRSHGVRGRVGIVEAMPPDDAELLHRFRAAGLRVDFFSFWRIWREGFPARAGQMWLTTRFHPHLLAAGAGALGMAVDIRPGYYSVMHQSLQKLGTGWAVASGAAAVAITPPAGNGDFAGKLQALTKSKAALAKRLYR
jgi:hypothetical protein